MLRTHPAVRAQQGPAKASNQAAQTPDPQRDATDLAVGECARLAAIGPSALSAMLVDLGCRPGQTVRLERRGLFGSPLYLCIGDRRMALRSEEARLLLLEPLVPAPASGDRMVASAS